MAWQGGNVVLSYPVGTGGVTKYKFVRLGAGGDAGKVVAVSAIDQVGMIGVAKETIAAGGIVDVVIYGKAKVQAGTGGMTSGSLVASDITGLGVIGTPADTTTATAFHFFFGTAEETVAINEIGTVNLTGMASYVNTTGGTL